MRGPSMRLVDKKSSHLLSKIFSHTDLAIVSANNHHGYTSGSRPSHSALEGENDLLEKKHREKTTILVPAVIIGGGPVGLSLSILLAKYGVRSLLLEKSTRLTEHPQAHFINNRTMEIFRQMDGLEAEIAAQQPPLDEWRNFVYCTSLTGTLIGIVDHFKSNGGPKAPASPTSVAHFSQNRLIPLLLDRATKAQTTPFSRLSFVAEAPSATLSHGAETPFPRLSDGTEPLPPVLMGHTAVAVGADPDGVTVTIEASDFSKNGGHERWEVRSKFVVAADGAGSGIRRALGIRMEGEGALQQIVNVHFVSRELGRRLRDTNGGRKGMLYFVFNPDVVMVVVAHCLREGSFVAQIPFYPPQQAFEGFTPEVCRGLIRVAAGIADLPLEIRSVRAWTMSAQVAESFVGGHGRIFLAGDAAHRFPPAGGFGMNTGIQDAHNLAWKLAAVHGGLAPPSLLLSYDVERREIAQANTALSVANLSSAMAIPSALGLNPDTASALHKAMNRPPLSLLPEGVQREMLNSAFALGRAQLAPWALNNVNVIGRARLAAVRRILEDGKSLQLQFPAEDIGFRYSAGALVNEQLAKDSGGESLTGQANKRCQEYVPSSEPGSRLPHVTFAALDSPDTTFSSIDLPGSHGLAFLLFVSVSTEGQRWTKKVNEAWKNVKVPLAHVSISQEVSQRQSLDVYEDEGEGPTEDPGPLRDATTRSGFPWRETSRELRVLDVNGEFWETCGVSARGALLVRPDGHVAWRCNSSPDMMEDFALEEVLSEIWK